MRMLDAFVKYRASRNGSGKAAREMLTDHKLRLHFLSDGMGDIVETWDKLFDSFKAGYRAGRKAGRAEAMKAAGWGQ